MRSIILIFTCFLVCAMVVPRASVALAQEMPQEVCSFGQNLYAGVKSPEVHCLQRFLNAGGFPVATEGAGSPGNETDYFGLRTARAVALWQRTMGVSPAQGFFGPRSRAAYQVLTQKAVSVSSSAVSDTSAMPVISSVTPDHITDGDTVVIRGRGFTADGNFVRYSIDPPGFAGRSASVDSGGLTLNTRIDTTVRSKIQSQIGGLPQVAQREIKIQFAKSINVEYGINAPEGVGYIPISLMVRNKNGMSVPFKIYVNVIP